MCDPISITFAVTTAVAGGMKAYAQYKEGAAMNKYYKSVANIQEEQGDLLFHRGEKQSELIQDAAQFQGRQQKTKAAQVESAQRAVLVANGIALDSVTSQDLVSDTLTKSKLDELAIRYNADIQSWNTIEDAKYSRWTQYTMAEQSRATGRNALASSKRQAFTTLLGTAASVAGAAVLGKALSAGGGGGGSTLPGSTGGGSATKISGSLGPQRTSSFLVRG